MDSDRYMDKPYRVIVSTDIGGSDPDDYQSMVHYLLYSDLFDTEGLLSSPWGEGTVADILQVIDCYEQDYPTLIKYNDKYPSPDYLRSITKQGVKEIAPYKGYNQETEASKWIVQCGRKKDSRPLYILIWGLLEDLAQALRDAPDIKSKLRVYYIGGPNKKWGLNAYTYIRENHPDLWFIENNSTYRGWFNGGIQTGDYGNESFVKSAIAGKGALGRYFSTHLGGVIKMGDTPSVAYLLSGNPEEPENESFGGSFVKAAHRKTFYFNHPTSEGDSVEVFDILEYTFIGPKLKEITEDSVFDFIVDGQVFLGYYMGNGTYKVRFMPKAQGVYNYKTSSRIKELDGLFGAFTCMEETYRTDNNNVETKWWSDRLEPNFQVLAHKGAKTVSCHRKLFLDDFEKRFHRCI